MKPERYSVLEMRVVHGYFPHIRLETVATTEDYYEAHEWACRVSETTGNRVRLAGKGMKTIGHYTDGRLESPNA